MTTQPLRIPIAEDSAAAAELMIRALRHKPYGGFTLLKPVHEALLTLPPF